MCHLCFTEFFRWPYFQTMTINGMLRAHHDAASQIPSPGKADSNPQNVTVARRQVALIVTHSPTHVGVDRHPQIVDTDLPVSKRRERHLGYLEVVHRRGSGRTLCQPNFLTY
jgi:hypothetical protein